ncbi:hypothetical protein GCM10009760_36810 [Kitasatospora kazusensis]|uniref:Uncharacterized protein n=1 Tax=Kitasatospora kazusensis TaxID=407974 RepID=A0ABP5LGG1_9ACTN
MAGQQYGQFGPARGGPYGWRGKLLCCLVSLLSLGMLGLVPSLLLALRRRRAVDVLGAVVFGLLTLTVFVAFGLQPRSSASTPSDPLLGLAVMVLWLGSPVHFLVLDSPRFWGMPGPVPAPFVPRQAQAAQAQAQAGPGQAGPGPVTAWEPPTVADPPAPDDLQQLGELLRRQVRDGRP